ncbi:MAG TPA: long-chain fatty acid--CoA ligase [Vicinamibacterales bacterium]|nr:long-chain fatty acid--CoA ligase [Vicinamibacterales bacterium]
MPPFPWLEHYDAGVPATLEPYPDRTLLDYLTETAQQWRDRPALLFKGATMKYAELERLSDSFAAALVELGVHPGDRVALCLPNCPQFLIAEFGAWKAGAIVTPINPTYSDRELESALTTTGAETIVVLNRFYEKLKALQPRTSLKRFVATNIKEYLPTTLRIAYTLLKEKKEGDRITVRDGDVCLSDLLKAHRASKRPAVRVAPDGPAVILMSGGTTGMPKGVVGTHRGMVVAGLQLQAWLRSAMREWTDTIMLPLPLFHTYANTGVQSLALINHNPIALIPNPRELRDVLQEINTVKPAFICAIPTLLNGIMNHAMTREGKVDFKSIKLCFSGAAALMAETKRRWEEMTGGVIVEGYSLTEAQMAVVANPVVGEKKIGSVGMPLPDVEVRIVDSEDGRTRMPQGEVGEIVVHAPQLMQGYWKNPDETREMLRVGPDGERLLYTGDLGYLDQDGYLFIVDRKKDLIKTSGYQVWPREIEEVISAHPAVAEVGVAGLPDKMRGEVVKAWIVLRPGMSVTAAEIKSFARERLAPYKVPSQFEFVSELPKSQVGKVLRRVLRQQEAAKDAGKEASVS